jgi:hypothetical protein
MQQIRNKKEYGEKKIKTAMGVSKETFNAMVEVLREAYIKRHSKHNGRHKKLSIEDMLLATMEYLYEYRTLECIRASYGLSKQNMEKTIRWAEDELISCGLFNLRGKRVLTDETEIEDILVDTTETPIQRPKKGQKRYYSGKKNGTQ